MLKRRERAAPRVALPSSGFLGLLGLVALLFAVSTLFSAQTLRREIRRARDHRQPPPDIARWWLAVVRRRAPILAAGALLALVGAAAFAADLEAWGRPLVIAGLLVLGYVAHAQVLVGVVRRAGA